MGLRMFKGKMWLHQLVLFGVLGLLILWSIINRSFIFNIDLLWWLLGAMIGFLFVFLDSVFYSVISKPGEISEIKIKELFAGKNFSDRVKLILAESFDQRELVMRSFLFLLVWIVLAFFTMTSVANMFARGFMLGIGTHLLFDFIYDYFKDKERLDLWFWQIKRTLEPSEKFWFMISVSVVYVFLAFGL